MFDTVDLINFVDTYQFSLKSNCNGRNFDWSDTWVEGASGAQLSKCLWEKQIFYIKITGKTKHCV
jgi:hypothetical protein